MRLIRQPINEPESETKNESKPKPDTSHTLNQREFELFQRLEHYMNSTKAWQDPDLSVKKLVVVLYSNRTSLLKVIQLHGYSGYISYVNGKRVAEFIQIINQQGGFNYQQTFFDVGFRCKTTALHNFRDITGMIPSEYFQKQVRGE